MKQKLRLVVTDKPKAGLFTRIGRFFKRAVKAAKNKIVDFFKGVYHHTEAIAVLVFASFGLTHLLGELPFVFTLPMWVEASLFFPVVSILLIIGMMKNAERRALNRGKLSHAA